MSIEDKFFLPDEPFETLYNSGLIEPEVWIEYMRVIDGYLISVMAFMVPEGVKVRQRDEEGYSVAEYLM